VSTKIVTVTDLLSSIRRDRWLIGSIVVLSLLIGGSIALLSTPVYRAELSMISAGGDDSASALGGLGGDLGFLASMAGVNVNSAGLRTEALAVLESRAFTRLFIARYDLLPILYAQRWSAEQGQWLDPETTPTLSGAVDYFDSTVRQVFEDYSTGVIRLTIEWSDRELAAQWANQLIFDLNKQMRERAILEAERSIKYLNEQLEKTTIVSLEVAIYGLIEEHIQRTALANVREDYVFRVFDVATPPDEDRYVFPNGPLILLLSLVVGGTLAGVAVLVRSFGLEGGATPHAITDA